EWQFKRVDADTMTNLIEKETTLESVLNQEEQDKVKAMFDKVADKGRATVEMKPLSPQEAPLTITRNEFMRRMADMQKMGGGGMFMMGDMGDHFNVVVNTNHPTIGKLLQQEDQKQEQLSKQLYDLALLSQNMLKGEALTNFVERSYELI
ncbi:MAG: molecular chaperone HtpG, partial [Chitinophagales bacterium]|nr:molecular chaperone HtpG [Chitinophagales bacterium]